MANTPAPHWFDEPDTQALRDAWRLMQTEPSVALPRLTALADNGSSSSMLYIATAYDMGVGVQVDPIEAEKWYRRSAERGRVDAYYALGRMHLKLGSYNAAKDAFERAVEGNYNPAINQLGKIYLQGLGVTRDVDRARQLLEIAAQRGSVYAKRRLAGIFMSGHAGFAARFKGVSLFFESLRDGAVALVEEGDKSERLR